MRVRAERICGTQGSSTSLNTLACNILMITMILFGRIMLLYLPWKQTWPQGRSPAACMDTWVSDCCIALSHSESLRPLQFIIPCLCTSFSASSPASRVLFPRMSRTLSSSWPCMRLGRKKFSGKGMFSACQRRVTST